MQKKNWRRIVNRSFEDYLSYISGLRNYSKNTLLAYTNNLTLFEKWTEEMNRNIFDLDKCNKCLEGYSLNEYSSMCYKN